MPGQRYTVLEEAELDASAAMVGKPEPNRVCVDCGSGDSTVMVESSAAL